MESDIISSPTKAKQTYLVPYEKDIISLLEQAQSLHEQVKSSPQRQASKVKQVDGLLQSLHSYILQLQIDQRSMAPSQKKKDLKAKLTRYNASYHKIENKQK